MKAARKKKSPCRPDGPLKYVEVVFPIPVNRSFTYTTDLPALPGCRVIAPCRGRKLSGFVIACSEEAPAADFQIKVISRLVDTEPLFDQAYLQMARWVAGMYFSSLGEALAAMIPGAKRDCADGSCANKGKPNEENNKQERDTVVRITLDRVFIFHAFPVL